MFVLVTDLLPRKSTIWMRLRSATWKITTLPLGPSFTRSTRSSRNPVSQRRRKSSFNRRSS